MALFSTKVESLRKKSESIVSIFTKTVNDLKIVNTETQAASDAKSAEIIKLQQEVTELESIKLSNEKVISKIETILS